MTVPLIASRQNRRAARISDVAAAAGVSTATVSRSLTFPDRVRHDTRERVMEAISRLGYTPNEAARVLRAGASRMVLVVMPQRYSPPFFADVLDGFDASLSAHGYTMILGSLDGAENKARRLTELVFARQIDGVIILTGHVPTIDGRSILDAGIPSVGVCAEIDRAGFSAVVIDDEDCAIAQTRHLFDLGHSQLMYLAGPENYYNEVHRYRGFVKATQNAGLDEKMALRLPGDYSFASGVAAAQYFLGQSPRPTGIVSACDESAIGFLKTVTQAGVRCPEDVSIVGFDGIEFGEFCTPTLTTIRQPRRELGAAGARVLLEGLQGKSAPPVRRTLLHGELLVRGSTGPAPKPRSRHLQD
jgi:LacI family transcriptional regulator, repressor for deo operon, udp, cdd, tsx, nupC, and nupG